MRIGTIGAGEVALAVAREALARGHEIVLSSRSGPGALADKVTELGRGASAATVQQVANANAFTITTSGVAGAAPAVFRFNGGPNHLSNNNAADSNWTVWTVCARCQRIAITRRRLRASISSNSRRWCAPWGTTPIYFSVEWCSPSNERRRLSMTS